jgi:hypothetical protein
VSTRRGPGPALDAQQQLELGAVLEAWRADAALLERYGHDTQAATIRQLCTDVERAAEDWLQWLSETDAVLKSGHAAPWLRARFAEWARAGHAEKRRGVRYYRACIVPQRPDFARITTLREEARRAARGEASARRRGRE